MERKKTMRVDLALRLTHEHGGWWWWRDPQGQSVEISNKEKSIQNQEKKYFASLIYFY
jgi:hypothetical protein